jgi:hypothetical protein
MVSGMTHDDELTRLATGFRERYLDYEALTAQLHAWEKAFPEVVQLNSIGRSGAGRELWLLTLGPDPGRVRPSVWVDANMHAEEICGSNVALALAEDVIRLHVIDAQALHGFPPHLIEALREVIFFILPRMSPDGAEAVLTTGRRVRSVPRNERPDHNRAYWVAQDIDGDGLSLVMRQQDPSGEFTACAEVPGLMLPRELEDAGPFYKIYPEGVIERFDGEIPTPTPVADDPVDLNRNFPYTWRPACEQRGAGPFPASEPESRAVVEFTSRRPELFAWLNLHTFGGVFIRPLGDRPDPEMDRDDLALYRQIAAWGERYAGYPTVSGYEQFTYKPNTPLYGDLVDYAYHQRGCIAYVCELWDLFRQAGLDPRPRFVDNYTHLSREAIRAIARWDARCNGGRSLPPWRAFTHPQIGAVEVGGLDPRFGLWNPPEESIASICEAQGAMFLRVAALAPRIVVTTELTSIDSVLTRVDATVANHGYLPSYILSTARRLEWNEPLCAELTAQDCELDGMHPFRREIGHLDGWGRGLFGEEAAPYFQGSRGSTSRRRLSWVVRGRGELTLRVGACRVGEVIRRLTVD